MESNSNKILSYLLEQIKSEADLTPAKTDTERKASAMLMKECIEKNKDVVESSKLIAMRCFKFSEDKIMYISENKIKEFKEKFGRDVESILKVFKDKKIISGFQDFCDKGNGTYYAISLPKDFDILYEKYKIVFNPDPGTSQSEKERLGKEKIGLEKIKEKLNSGYYIEWRCRGCGCSIKNFVGNEGFESIKKYLVNFKKNILEPCPARGGKHLNWFEIKENAILYFSSTSFDTELRPIEKLVKKKEFKK